MSSTIFIFLSFIIGIGFTLILKRFSFTKILDSSLWTNLYKYIAIYLLVVLGIEGGHELASESLFEIWVPTLVGVAMSLFSAMFMYYFFKYTNIFDRITGISIATHFGAVSIGTFFAGIALLESLGIDYNHASPIWLVAIEFSSVILGMILLKARAKTIKEILIKDKALSFLPLALLINYTLSKYVGFDLYNYSLDALFTPLLWVCLFLLGKIAAEHIIFLGKNSIKIVLAGVIVPTLVSFFAASVGILLGYGRGDVFLFSLLAASCSTVIAPLSVKEILYSMYTDRAAEADRSISTSLAISIGVTLPFNILFGFELFLFEQKLVQQYDFLLYTGVMLPFVIIAVVYILRWVSSVSIDELDFEEIEL